MIIKSDTVAVVSMVPYDPGTEVLEGDTVIIIECMKVMIEIATPVTGIIKKIFKEPGDMIEEGEPLVEIEEAAR